MLSGELCRGCQIYGYYGCEIRDMLSAYEWDTVKISRNWCDSGLLDATFHRKNFLRTENL